MESEAELTEAEGADEQLLALLGLREASPPSHPQTAPVKRERRRPGKRAERRDMAGQEPNGEEQAVGWMDFKLASFHGSLWLREARWGASLFRRGKRKLCRCISRSTLQVDP